MVLLLKLIALGSNFKAQGEHISRILAWKILVKSLNQINSTFNYR